MVCKLCRRKIRFLLVFYELVKLVVDEDLLDNVINVDDGVIFFVIFVIGSFKRKVFEVIIFNRSSLLNWKVGRVSLLLVKFKKFL